MTERSGTYIFIPLSSAFRARGGKYGGVTKTKNLENEDLRPKTQSSFSYYKNEDPSQKNCLLFNENFPAEKA